MKFKALRIIGAPIALAASLATCPVGSGASSATPPQGQPALRNYATLLSTTACRNWSVYNRDQPFAPAPRDPNQTDVYHGVTVRDPFRPLESLNAPATHDWVQAQNRRVENFIGPLDDAHSATMNTLQQADDFSRETPPIQVGRFYVSQYHDGSLQQTRLLVRDIPNGQPRILLDVDSLSPDQTVSLAFYQFHTNGLMAYALSAQGSDKLTLRIRDIKTGQDLPDVIHDVPHLQTLWDRDGKGFLYQAPDAADPNKMALKHHQIGDPVDQDPVVLRADAMETPFFNLGRAGNNDFIYAGDTGTGKSQSWRRVAGDDTFRPFPGGYFTPVTQIGNQVYGMLRDGDGFGRLARMNPDAPATGWQTIIPENKARTVDNIFYAGRRFFVLSTENMASRLDVYNANGTHIKALPLPQDSTYTLTGINDKTVHIYVSQLTERRGVYKYDIVRDQLSLDQHPPVKSPDVVIEHLTAISKDGTSVPYTVVRAPTTRLDGTAAVNIYSYGGFREPMSEDFEYNPLDWVRAGGIFVQAHLRGGGEFGNDWYQNGSLDQKENTFDDLAAVAKELAQDGYTTPERTVLTGTSNGGMTVLATAVKHPELFGAVVASVPVTDLYRFSQFTYGHYWRSSYGDPLRSKKDFDVVSRYSPLHNITTRHYPATMIMTAENDDRVVPLHSYKMMAAFQASATPSSLGLLYVQSRAGHGAGQSRTQRYSNVAIAHTFASRAIGPIAQNDYVALREEQSRAAASSPDVAQCQPSPMS